MPLPISEVWEYWVPDEEVAEVLAMSGAYERPFDGLSDYRGESRGWNLGIRFGRGNPDKACFKIARARHNHWVAVLDQDCVKCGYRFTPYRNSRTKYCKDCSKIGRPRTRPDVSACVVCGKEFAPERMLQKCCGTACSAKIGREAALLSTKGICKPPPVEKVNRFREMYEGGAPMKEIQRELGVDRSQLKRWRTKCNIPPRPTGNHSRPRGGKP